MGLKGVYFIQYDNNIVIHEIPFWLVWTPFVKYFYIKVGVTILTFCINFTNNPRLYQIVEIRHKIFHNKDYPDTKQYILLDKEWKETLNSYEK